jgi:hypothetical protein
MAALGPLAFSALLWGAILAVLGVFLYVAAVLVREWMA